MATAFDIVGREAGPRTAQTLVTAAVEAARAPASDWSALADHAAEDNVFFHPDFALPAVSGLARRIEIATMRDADCRLIAAVPVTRSRLGRIASAVRLWSHEYGPLGTPLVAPEAVTEAIEGLIEGLSPPGSGASLIVPDLPLDGPVAIAIRGAAQRLGRPIDVMEAHERAVRRRGEADAMATLSRKRRRNIARLLERLRETGEIAFDVARDAASVAIAFEALLVLEAKGWKGRRGSAMAGQADIAAFARKAVTARAEAGAAQVDTLSVDGVPVAALVSLIAGATAYTWKIAYDEAYARYSPGVHIMLRGGESLFENPAVQLIDSCATADHPMVNGIWSGRMSVGTMVVGPPGGGVLHRLGLAAAGAEVAARAAARRLRG